MGSELQPASPNFSLFEPFQTFWLVAHMLYLAKRCYSTFPRIERPTLEQIQFANRIFQQPATFVKSIAQPDQAPNTTCPEVVTFGTELYNKNLS